MSTSAQRLPAGAVIVDLPARRSRVSPEAVRAVVATLGDRATLARVRQALGGGSMRDIARVVKEVRETPLAKARASLARDADLAPALVSGLDALEAAQRELKESQAAEIAALRAEIRALKTQAGHPAPCRHDAPREDAGVSAKLDLVVASLRRLESRVRELPEASSAAPSNVQAVIEPVIEPLVGALQRLAFRLESALDAQGPLQTAEVTELLQPLMEQGGRVERAVEALQAAGDSRNAALASALDNLGRRISSSSARATTAAKAQATAHGESRTLLAAALREISAARAEAGAWAPRILESAERAAALAEQPPPSTRWERRGKRHAGASYQRISRK